MLILGAIPLFMMELALGQFHRQGAVSVWRISPIFKGIGICQCLIAYYVAFYYNVIIAWSIYFLMVSLMSFVKPLPWMKCDNAWNTDACVPAGTKLAESNVTVVLTNVTSGFGGAYNATYGHMPQRLDNISVWIDAATQIFYSVGAGFGVHIAYASYNKFNNNFYRDALATACINSFTSLFSGFVIFCYLGYMAKRLGTDIDKVATEGLRDETRHILVKYKYGRELLTLGVCLVAFVFSLQNITYGGMYMFTIWDIFSAGTSILFGVFFMVVTVGWVYGMQEFCDDFKKMLGFRPNLYWRICWKFISPLFILRIALGITPTWEHREIMKGEPVKRFKVSYLNFS
ncbi:hypothetical protein LSH36_65g08008 [Paralvinella palmiformis]|uniref:Uncharacterized protein n=1 Tax=Paralvinella palmiformis TaxID=53620 RepID=A0AAD9K589_9ANNE|nr:hypothetical protein LSH36_65g08008 [Paralvinella palmiformis]